MPAPVRTSRAGDVLDAARLETDPLAWEEAVDRGVDAFRQSVGACLSAYPEAATELSGGMDSRGMLAAVPTAARDGMIAITFAPTSSPDHRVATLIANRWGMEHQTVDTDELERLSGDDAAALVRRAARRRDFTGNPFVFGLTDWAESQVDQRPRLSGVRGEAARGVYYPGQPRRASTDDKLVESFLRWRVMVNDVIDPTLLTPEFVPDAKATEIRVMKGVFKEFGEPWLEATDRYGWFRAQRWQGLNYNAACLDRAILMPFGSPASSKRWAWRTRPDDRRHSRLFGQVMTPLDPELAAMPLDTGLVPARLGRGVCRPSCPSAGGWPAAAPARSASACREAGETGGDHTRTRRAGVEHWKTLDEPLAALARLDFLNYETIRQVTSGERTSTRYRPAFSSAWTGCSTSSNATGGHAMWALVAIANHGTKNRQHLDRLLEEYRTMSYKCDIVVLSDIPKDDLGADVEVRVGRPLSHPWSLGYAHRPVFDERRDDYDLYIYTGGRHPPH